MTKEIETSGSVPAAKVKKIRGEYVPDSVFIPAWEKCAADGTNAKGVAAITGLAVSSVNQRAMKLRKRLKDAKAANPAIEFTLAPMTKGGGPRTNIDEVQALLAGFRKPVETESTAG